jgi:hypothetical protein
MQLKTKYLMPVLTAVLMVGLSTAAFAQESCSVASTPVSRDTATGLTEVAGDLTFTCTFGGINTTAGATITVLYPGATITDSTTYPSVATGIRVNGISGGFVAPTSVTVTNTSSTGGIITIQLPMETASGGFTLTGVLLSLQGVTAPLNVNVSASPGTGILIVAGQNVATVITNILPGIKDPKVDTSFLASATGLIIQPGAPTAGNLVYSNTSGVSTVLSSGIISSAGFAVDITENYQDMFRSAAQFNSGNSTQDTELLLTFSNIPTGVSLTGCGVYDKAATPGAVNANITATLATLTPTANTETIDFTGPVDQLNVDTVTFYCAGITLPSTPLVAGTPAITVTATLAPTGSALSSTGGVLTTGTTGQIPRYTLNAQPATPLTVVIFVSAQTDLLIPYAVTTTGGYDTGIALANTTTDPFGGKTLGGAVATAGTLALSFYPQTGAACFLTTGVGLTGSGTVATTPASFTMSPVSGLGVGLDATGSLKSGGTWVVLLSQLLGAAPAAAGCPSATGFTGYIFIVANSSEVHGSAFISNFSSFTSATNVLVLPPPSTVSGTFNRSALTGGFETLGN